MSAISAVGKVAYIYDQPNDTWHPVAGYANTTETYTWSGRHNFNNTVNFNSVLNAKAGVNNFADEATRDSDLPSPENGAVCFVRSLNQIQYRSNGVWRTYGDNANLTQKVTDHQLELSDAGKTIQMNVPVANTVIIPNNSFVPFPIGTQIAFIQMGLGQTSFVSQGRGAAEVEILNKGYVASPKQEGNRKIAARYSPATLIKRDTDSWILIGDLTA
jgi:hypothetical protein